MLRELVLVVREYCFFNEEVYSAIVLWVRNSDRRTLRRLTRRDNISYQHHAGLT